MGRLVMTTNVTLDGVMQAPGAPDEDTRGDFHHGGDRVSVADADADELLRAGRLLGWSAVRVVAGHGLPAQHRQS